MDNYSSFNIFNFNASRCSNLGRIQQLYDYFEEYDPMIVCIQEINVASALRIFSDKYQVYVNFEQGVKDGIGIVSLIKYGIKVQDEIIGSNGRIIGLRIANMQIWNVYPKSGSTYKKEREVFFREILCNLFMNWKDSTEYIIQAGDHNCIHREQDSLNNSQQHMQPGLVKHMQIHGLSDDFIKVHGRNQVVYSRITQNSRTRIDYVLSNTNKCINFQYLDTGMGLDHKAMFVKYDIELTQRKEFIPRERYCSGWVISKRLENDDCFMESCKLVFKLIKREEESGQQDPSFNWLKMKSAIISIAMEREKQIQKEQNKKIEVLRGFYSSVLIDMQRGEDCSTEFEDLRRQMNNFYEERSKSKIDKMRKQEIDDHVYDIHKLQNQRKYESQKKINEIKIGGEIFTGNKDVIDAIEGKMKQELKAHSERGLNEPVNDIEKQFLAKLRELELSNDEKEALIGPITEEEISYILEQEIDKDSSPGIDGITYRFIRVFWEFPEYRQLYIKYLNYKRDDGSLDLVENVGIMTIKNKKRQSNLYEKKRKLTKVNKESNLNSKVWTNRFKKIILSKVLPKTQYNCQEDINIIDELREIRMVNMHLMGNGKERQNDGTILSIDFEDAFRSISHRWFNLVMKFLKVPDEFIKWFWAMYHNLHVVVVLNKYKSNEIAVERGFMEGHCPSMAAFVVALIPLMYALEEKIEGIETASIGNQKMKMFADDLKLFLGKTSEVNIVYEIICKFEVISGLKMHRNPEREKCKALPFGTHRNFKGWPDWVTVKDKINIVGGVFSNKESFEKINSELAEKSFLDALHKSYGIRGTIFQKAYYVNTYLFSKLWFTAQFCKLDQKMLKKILSKALAFIYSGENERPVNSVNFRSTMEGGLGLFHPIIKAKALMVRNMYRELLSIGGDIYDMNKIRQVYGYREEFEYVIENGFSTSPSKAIYDFLIKENTHRNGSLIPSRSEKRSKNVKWGIVYKNLKLLRGVTPEEKCFAWKLSQDMLPVGARIHRRNAEKRCLAEKDDGTVCEEIQDRDHVFRSCSTVAEKYDAIIRVLNSYTERLIGNNLLIHLAFNHRSKQRLRCALWVAVKMLYCLYWKNQMNKEQLLKDMIKEIDWNISLNRKIGSECEMVKVKEVIIDMMNIECV